MQKPHNNQELFSNYYLGERLPDRDIWQEPKGLEETYRELSQLYEERKNILEATKEAQTEEEWIKPILHILGFKYIPQPSETIFDTTKVPDYAFFLNDKEKEQAYKSVEEDKKELFDYALAVGDAKRWDLNLNNLRPNKQVDEYLRITDTKWGLLTNGRLWRIYHLDSSYRLDTYYEVDLVELIEAGDEEKFKYFYLFFQPPAFTEDGFLTEVYERSEDYTASVSEDLKENAFDALQELCQGFLSGNPDLGEEDLEDIYENSLVLLYRVIFLLYAESDKEENLLPMDNDTYRNQYSLTALKGDAVEDTQKGDSLLNSSHQYWSRLRDLFSFIDKGEDNLGVYEYNGGLFDRERHPFIDEKHSIGDRYVAEAVRKVSYSGAEGGFIDYQDLDVRELGAIYEGLLEHKPVIESKRVKWEEDLSERKKTGSYYTPEYVVKYIVENTIGPLVEEKKEELQDEIEELEQKKKGSRSYDREVYEDKLKEKREEAREEILDLKVLDPAMGSGHFLVEATEKLANEIAALEEEFSPEENDDEIPVAETNQEDPVKELKRQIVERSIYGVDKNPLATELAKLSLWLHTVAKNEPLSFLDHHLRTGDSLIGLGVEEMKTMPSEREKMAGLFTSNLIQDLGNVIGHLNLIEEITSGSREDVKEKKTEWQDIREWIDKYKKAANVRLSTS
ncbi:MAG: N-6 DNA methylase, partial [Candidatus Acetothermia bacterium]